MFKDMPCMSHRNYSAISLLREEGWNCHFLLVVSLPLSLQVLVESYLQSASFGHIVAVQCIRYFLYPSTAGASFLVSSRFVLYCHCLCFFSSGWSCGLFTCSGGSDVFLESGLVRWSSVPATLIAVPVLEQWQVPLVLLADSSLPGIGPDQEVCTLEEVSCNLFWLCLVCTIIYVHIVGRFGS